jgi:hypothetical protein
MWIYTKYGFFSAVCARAGDGSYRQQVDPDRMMIRARVREHLEALRTRFPAILQGCEILATSGTDYAYRLFVPKSGWTRIVGELADEIDYDNFKSEVARHQGPAGHDYEASLHDVWSVMNKLQK